MKFHDEEIAKDAVKKLRCSRLDDDFHFEIILAAIQKSRTARREEDPTDALKRVPERAS